MPYKDKGSPEALESLRAARRKHYHANKGPYIERAKRAREEIDNYIREVKSAPCADCGQQYPHYVMDLDHRDPSQKIFEPAKLSRNGSMKKAVTEVAKCDVVCSNCHRQRTHGGPT